MENKSTFNDSCEAMKSLMAIYTILEAAALWCGIKKQDLPDVISKADQISTTGIGRSIYKHPYISCIEPFTRAIAQAVDDRSLPHCREDGKVLGESDMAAHERRHVTGVALKKWIETAFPNDRPSFLFDDLERDTHTSISADAYRVLKIDRDALKIRIINAELEYRKLQSETRQLFEELNRLNSKLGSSNVTATTKRNYELMIGLLTKALADKAGPSCGDKRKPNYSGLSELLQQYLPVDGLGLPSNKSLSSENLRKKITAAFKLLESN